MAAPAQTASSGCTEQLRDFLKNSSSISLTFGIRVLPPTNMISSIFYLSIFADFRASTTGGSNLS